MPRVLSPADVADFRQKLCAEAASLFAAKGREGFTMRELAAALGVSAMTPYRYFKDKDDILAAVRADAFDRFAQALEGGFDSAADAPSRSGGVGDAYVRFAFENPSSYRLMFDMSQDDADYPELMRAGERARRTMTGYVRALVDAGLLEGDPELIGHVFWATLHGAVMLHLAGKLTAKYDFTTVREAAFRALAEGFRPGR